MLIICCLIVGILVILEFIPIKYASRLNEFHVDSESTKNVYICDYATATDGNWVAWKELNPWLSETTYLNIQEDKVFDNISKIFTTEYEEPSNNLFVYWGKVKHKQVAENFTINILNVEKWNIVYPIKRKSIRGLYAPKGYLTIYDYNWIEVIKDSFTDKTSTD